MSILDYLQLQTVDPQDDGSVSDLDAHPEDETIDLSSDIDEATLNAKWDEVLDDIHGSDPKQTDGDK